MPSAESRRLSLRFLRLPLQSDNGAGEEEVITPPGVCAAEESPMEDLFVTLSVDSSTPQLNGAGAPLL